MRRLAALLFLVLAMGAQAQTDAAPEHEHPFAPDSMPPIDTGRLPVSGKLDVTFVGQSAFRERQLREGIARQIQTIEDYGLDSANAYDAMFFLESFYRKNGYSQAEGEYRILGPWHLELTIKEGPFTRVGEITINGNKVFNTETLTDYLLGPIRERYPRIRKDINLPFVEADIYSGVDLMRRFYEADGYLNVAVEPPTITFNDDESAAAITLNINEGIQYRFGTINLEGPLIFSREELLAVIAEQTKNIYTDGRLAAAQRALEDFYEKRGYFTVQVVADSDIDAAKNGNVPTVFQVSPGPLFHFDSITVTGNSGVKTSFIQKRMRKLKGKVYDPKLIDKSFRTLIETGLFKNLRISPEATENNEVRLDVSVEEAKPKEFGIGVGYASFFGGIVSLSYADRNFLGTGRSFASNIEANQRGFNGEVIYNDPWLFDTDYQLRLRLYAVNAVLKGYSKNEIGFQPTLTRHITKHWKVSGFLTAKFVSLYDVLIEPSSLVGETEYSVFTIGFSQTLDYRNNPTLPTSGYIFTSSVDLAPNNAGDIAYLRALGRFSYYIPVTAKSYLALGARGGIIAPLDNGELPIDERFFSGGATTVRSFSELTLGPRDSAGYPLGGEAFTVFNAEYTFPLFGDLQGAVFVDAGNVVSEAADFGLEDMRYAVGAGLRYNLPIGAIRIDYGLNPSPKPGEAQGAFQFAIGVAF